MSKESNPLTALSEAMTEAGARAGAATLLVNARRRFPASGIAYTPDLILTADHVVERDEDIVIMLPDGSQVKAIVAGRDPGSDLALLRLERAVASAAEPASQDPRVGQLALSLGRPAWASSARLAGRCAPGAVACWSATCAPMPFPTRASLADPWWIPPGA